MVRYWTRKELIIIRDNIHLSPKGLVELLPERSVVSIAQTKKKFLGTANRLFKRKWNVPSKDLAYFVGILCSDGHIGGYTFEISQAKKNEQVIYRVKDIIKNIFGLQSTIKEKDNTVLLTCSSNQFMKEFGIEISGKKKVKPEGEWFYLIEKIFQWVLKDKYFWSFMSGLMDGDGSLVRRNSKNGTVYSVALAIFAMESAGKMKDELLKRGFSVKMYEKGYTGLIISNISEVKRFVNKLDCVLLRKNSMDVKGDKELYVKRINKKIADIFLQEFHYLKTNPVGVFNYGFYRGEILEGVASVSKYNTVKDIGDFVELRRFALSNNEKNLATKFLSRLRKCVINDFKGCVGMVTFADTSKLHEGIIYKAMSALYVGDVKSNIFYFSDGTTLNGRFIDTKLAEKIDNGEHIVKVQKCIKKKYVLIYAKGGLRQKIVGYFRGR